MRATQWNRNHIQAYESLCTSRYRRPRDVPGDIRRVDTSMGSPPLFQGNKSRSVRGSSSRLGDGDNVFVEKEPPSDQLVGSREHGLQPELVSTTQRSPLERAEFPNATLQRSRHSLSPIRRQIPGPILPTSREPSQTPEIVQGGRDYTNASENALLRSIIALVSAAETKGGWMQTDTHQKHRRSDTIVSRAQVIYRVPSGSLRNAAPGALIFVT